MIPAPANCPAPVAVRPASFARRRLLSCVLALAAPWAAGCAAAPTSSTMLDGRWLRLQVVDRDSGDDLRVWRAIDASWVAGSPGTRYALRLTNRSGERLLAVVSVDGVNIVSGETAAADQRGYVLGPWQSVELTGWRKSDAEVAAFEFTRLGASYAARAGRPLDVGVIGAAVFRERAQPVALESSRAAPAPEARSRGAADANEGAAARPPGSADSAQAPALLAAPPRAKAAPAERLGTGHGARETSWVTTVAFDRATSSPEEVLQLRYDGFDRLVAAGIVPRPRPLAQALPRPFPGDANGYVPDPAGN